MYLPEPHKFFSVSNPVSTPSAWAKARKFFLLAAGIVALDQLVKFLVKLNMTIGRAGEIPILGDWFKLHFIENPGAAFGLTVTHIMAGMGMELPDSTGKLILTLFSIVAVSVIGYVLFRLRDHHSRLPWFVAMIFGGALGNIIDRTFYGLWFNELNISQPEPFAYSGGLFHGRVVDMFYFDIWEGFIPAWVPGMGGEYYSLWPIFNIADSAISIGIVIILVFQGRFFRQDEKWKTAAETPSPKETTPEVATQPEISPEIPANEEATASENENDADPA